MNTRLEQLRRKREDLQWQCAAQRLELKATIENIQSNLGWLDRGIAIVQRFGRSPLLMAGGIAAFLLIGPMRFLRVLSWSGRMAFLASAYKRLLR